jgi:hypothetical protein
MLGGWPIATALLTALATGSTPTPPPSEPGPLRLDESPALPLLEPFRHAAGRPATTLSQYQGGPYGDWTHRAWMTLDWTPPAPAAINPRPEARAGDACMSRLLSEPGAWPQRSFAGHWFVEGRGEVPLALSPEIVPPWLARLDPYWAHALLLLTGCGAGGECSPGSSFPGSAFEQLWQALGPADAATPWWVCRERPVRFARQEREQDSFVVLHCDGSVPDGALERLSILARPTGVERPPELAPEPDPRAPRGEWTAGVRLLHPRLLWVLHQVALAFPWRGIFLYSGYRFPEEGAGEGHRSQHTAGRALDIRVYGVKNEDLFKLCSELSDVFCGYYPNHKFVHFDVRRRGTGSGIWIDASGPGEPSHYLDSWPGVVEAGRVVHERVKEKPWMR